MTQAEQLAVALDDAGARLVRITHLRGPYIVITLDWGGQQLQFTASITEVLAGRIPDMPKRRQWDESRRSPNIYGQREWTEDALRAEGLPLYWDEEWFQRTLADLGSYAEMERVYGYSQTTLATWGARYGVSRRPSRSEARKAVIAEWRGGNHNKKALARKYGVSIGSVFNWVKNDSPA